MPKKKPPARKRLAAIGNTSVALARPGGAALVQPSFVAVLDTARRVIACELGHMERGQSGEKPMTLAEAKKLQALVQSLATAQTMEIQAKADDVSGLSDAQLTEQLREAIDELRVESDD